MNAATTFSLQRRGHESTIFARTNKRIICKTIIHGGIGVVGASVITHGESLVETWSWSQLAGMKTESWREMHWYSRVNLIHEQRKAFSRHE